MLTQKYVQYRRARPKRLGPNIPNMELTTKRAGKSCRVEPCRSLVLCWDRLARISSYEKEEKKFSLRLSLSNLNSYSFIDQAYASSSPRTKSQADVQYSVRRPNEPADYQWDYTTNCCKLLTLFWIWRWHWIDEDDDNHNGKMVLKG